MDIVEWLESLPGISNVRYVRVTIGKQSWEGAEYDSEHKYTRDMMCVQSGQHKAGETYITHQIYLVGHRPIFRRPTCFTFQGKDWYVSCYLDTTATLEPAQKQYHPFGVTFQISPWTATGSIDDYEPKPYTRIPMTVS